MNQPRNQPWWQQRLQSLFEALGADMTMRRSVRGVRVRRLDIQPGAILARLHDREVGEGSIELHAALFSDAQWTAIIEEMADQALFAAQLLTDQLPAELEQIMLKAGAVLIPQQAGDVRIVTSFATPDRARQLAAMANALEEMLQGDPWLLLLLRGRHREAVLNELRQARAEPSTNFSRPPDVDQPTETALIYHTTPGVAAMDEAQPLALQLDHFWGDSRQLRALHHYIAAPTVDVALLRRLGPVAQRAEWQNLNDQLATLYRRVTNASLALAYDVELGQEEEEGNDK